MRKNLIQNVVENEAGHVSENIIFFQNLDHPENFSHALINTWKLDAFGVIME
jgi:hypothetical protein